MASRDLKLIAFLFMGFPYCFFDAKLSPGKEITVSSVNNADPKGTKAFFTLLNRLGYNARKLVEPVINIPADAKILFVVQPEDKFDSRNVIDLTNWVQNKGGVAIFLSDKYENIPATYRKTRPMGKGWVYSFDSRFAITNEGMRNYKNALKFLKIIERHSAKGSLILFDEYHHGEMKSILVLSIQVKLALWIAGFAVLLLCYSYGRRFGAVRSLPNEKAIRPSYEFVESVASLYQRAGASDLAAEIILDSFKSKICARLGLPSDASSKNIAGHLEIIASGEIAERVDKLLANLDAIHEGQKLTDAELLKIAVEITKLEEELGLAGYTT